MKNNKKINKTRRNRGYAFEAGIVKEFSRHVLWSSVRLGSPSTKLPDVMCINNDEGIIIAIEAKSTLQNLAYVPSDQIQRCVDWINLFESYDKRYVVLAFKFGQTSTRKLRVFYKIFEHTLFESLEVKAAYDGKTMIKENGEWFPLVMEDFKI